VQFVDLIGGEIMADNGHSSANANILIFGRFFGQLQRCLGSVRNEVERSAALHGQRGSCVMRQHKNRRVKGRIVSPPAFPGFILPWTSNRPEHITTNDPGADIVRRLGDELIVDTLGFATLTMNPVEYLCLPEPGVYRNSLARLSGRFATLLTTT